VCGGPDRDRTDDLLDANQALSQLSYGPKRYGTPIYICCLKHDSKIHISGFENQIVALPK
jgi:hypothetical protein